MYRVTLGVSDLGWVDFDFYPVSHPIEPRDFVLFSFMTCDCPLVWLGLAFESSTFGLFSEKPRGLTEWESGYVCIEILPNCIQPGAAMPSSVSVATAEIVAQQSQDYVDEQLAEYQNQIQQLQGRTIERKSLNV